MAQWNLSRNLHSGLVPFYVMCVVMSKRIFEILLGQKSTVRDLHLVGIPVYSKNLFAKYAERMFLKYALIMWNE